MTNLKLWPGPNDYQRQQQQLNGGMTYQTHPAHHPVTGFDLQHNSTPDRWLPQQIRTEYSVSLYGCRVRLCPRCSAHPLADSEHRRILGSRELVLTADVSLWEIDLEGSDSPVPIIMLNPFDRFRYSHHYQILTISASQADTSLWPCTMWLDP